MEKIVIGFIPAYIAFITFLGVYMFRRRAGALRAGQIPAGYFKTYQGEVPRELKVIQNCFENQFQVPILFFVTCLAAVLLGVANSLMIRLGFTFFASRLWHAYIHLGSNSLRLRPLAYAMGLIVLIGMWAVILIQGQAQ